MLDELSVENLGIIERARIEPGPGLVAVTGETGTGKTLLLGALRLLRGDTARTDRIGPHGDEAHVEGRFLFGDDEVGVSRRVGAQRSRAYLDGAMVPARALEERLGPVVEIVAQHEHVGLGRPGSVRQLIDGLLDDEGQAARAAYAGVYRELTTLRAEAAEVGGDHRLLTREVDLLTHQATEIAAAGLSEDEEADLVSRLRRLRHAGEITEALGRAHGALDDDTGALELLRTGLHELRIAAKLDPDLGQSVTDLEGLIASAEELSAGIRAATADLDHEPGALRRDEERAGVIADLKRKYGASVTEVLEFGTAAADRAQRLRSMLERAEVIDAELVAVEGRAREAGRRLSELRRSTGARLATSATEILRSLGFRDPVIRFDFDEVDPGASGIDRIGLAFASDSGLQPGPVARVASGGELSRLVLAVRVAAGVAEAPVVAFDEVDAGVGGATALAMGRQLQTLSRGGQVLVVTHLPQVAAFADRHFVVERDGASASVRCVVGEDRVAELARMLGGLSDSEGGRLHAEELLELADQHRTA